jgi:hypothetical protein
MLADVHTPLQLPAAILDDYLEQGWFHGRTISIQILCTLMENYTCIVASVNPE